MNDEADSVDVEALAIIRCVHALEPVMTKVSRARVLKYLEERYGQWGDMLADIHSQFASYDLHLGEAAALLKSAAESHSGTGGGKL